MTSIERLEELGMEERIQVVMSDDMIESLRDAADARGVGLEELLMALLVAASERVDELLGPTSRTKRRS